MMLDMQADTVDHQVASRATCAKVPIFTRRVGYDRLRQRMRSLQREIIVRVLLAMLATLVVSGAGLYIYARFALIREFDLGTAAKARTLAALVEIDPHGALEVEFTAESLPEYYSKAPDRFFELRRADGSVLARSPSLNGRTLLPTEAVLEPHEGFDLDLPNGRPGRATIVRFQAWPEPAKPGVARQFPADLEDFTLVLARDRGELNRTLRLLLTAMLFAGVALEGMTVAAIVFVVRRGLRPVQTVATRTASIDAQSLSTRLPVEGLATELRPICECINDLLGRVESGFSRERQFNANVAHELRTPIAELRALAEVCIEESRMSSTPPHHSHLDALDIALHMEAIVAALLSLARCQAGTQVVSSAPIDLPDLVRASWRKYADTAAKRELHVDFELPPGLAVVSDRSLLGAVLDNIFSNATQYSVRGGSVSCTLHRTAARVSLVVANTAADLTPEDLSKICEPFWRKDASRAASSHSGLGLALVDAYTRLLGIGFAIHLAPDHQLVTTLMFEAVDQPVTEPIGPFRRSSDSSDSSSEGLPEEVTKP